MLSVKYLTLVFAVLGVTVAGSRDSFAIDRFLSSISFKYGVSDNSKRSPDVSKNSLDVSKRTSDVSEGFSDVSSDISKSFLESQESKESLELVNCLHGCPRILDPICAVDAMHPMEYKYFHNQCLMEYENCRQSRAWKPTQMLLCIKDIDPVIRDDCMRACPLIYNPVCATDGKNYEIFGNQCSFGMENCLASGKWLEVHAEQCGL